MYAVRSGNLYGLEMMDHRPYQNPAFPSLDQMVTETYGRLYKGQQTGDMLSNDSYHLYDMTGWQLEEWLYGVDEDEPFYDPPQPYGGDRTYYGRAGFNMWLADDKEYKYDFQHYRQAPVPQVALAMLIEDGHLPSGRYLVRVSW